MLIRRITEVEPKYYADGEDAFAMRRDLVSFAEKFEIQPADPATFFAKKPIGSAAAAAQASTGAGLGTSSEPVAENNHDAFDDSAAGPSGDAS